jgi:hypothetical protein
MSQAKKRKRQLKEEAAQDDEEKIEEGGKERLNLLINGDLKRWAHQYAKRKCTSITAIVTSHLVELREREKGIDVEQV